MQWDEPVEMANGIDERSDNGHMQRLLTYKEPQPRSTYPIPGRDAGTGYAQNERDM